MGTSRIKVTTVTDNYSFDERCGNEWGFAAVIETPSGTVLFDTGASGAVLMKNLRLLDFDPREFDTVVISHDHWDHTGGLRRLLRKRRRDRTVRLFLPDGFDDRKLPTSRVERIIADPWTEVIPGVFTTGTLGAEAIAEQALVVTSGEGAAVITGCAHPGIVAIVKRAVDRFGEPLSLVVGGFHLFRSDIDERQEVIAALEEFDMRRFAPSHCTGDEALRELEKRFPTTITPAGAGRVFELEPVST